MTGTVGENVANAFDFLIQMVSGTASFVGVFLLAVGARWVVSHCEAAGLVPKWMELSADVVEIAIWGADLAVFALFLFSEVRKSYLRYAEEWKTPHG